MGSSTVLGEGEPLSYAMLPVLTCQDIGMPSTPRAKKPSAKSLMLPTALVMPIPAGPAVLVGGAPTINMAGFAIGAAQKALGKALKKALQGKHYQRNLPPTRCARICTLLR